MNLSVCQKCRRFSGKTPENDKVWLCAEVVYMRSSEVIPGHRYLCKDKFHYLTADVNVPPEWCERPLEQTILDPEEKVNIESHEQRLVFDGNKDCEYRVLKKHERGQNW